MNFVIGTLKKIAPTAGAMMPKIVWVCLILMKIMRFLVPDDQLKTNETHKMADMCGHFVVPKCGADHRAFHDSGRTALLLSVALWPPFPY